MESDSLDSSWVEVDEENIYGDWQDLGITYSPVPDPETSPVMSPNASVGVPLHDLYVAVYSESLGKASVVAVSPYCSISRYLIKKSSQPPAPRPKHHIPNDPQELSMRIAAHTHREALVELQDRDPIERLAGSFDVAVTPTDAFCPSCMKHYSLREAQQSGGMCRRCPVCPRCGSDIATMTLEDNQCIVFCKNCYWHSEPRKSVAEFGVYLNTLRLKNFTSPHNQQLVRQLRGCTSFSRMQVQETTSTHDADSDNPHEFEAPASPLSRCAKQFQLIQHALLFRSDVVCSAGSSVEPLSPPVKLHDFARRMFAPPIAVPTFAQPPKPELQPGSLRIAFDTSTVAEVLSNRAVDLPASPSVNVVPIDGTQMTYRYSVTVSSSAYSVRRDLYQPPPCKQSSGGMKQVDFRNLQALSSTCAARMLPCVTVAVNGMSQKSTEPELSFFYLANLTDYVSKIASIKIVHSANCSASFYGSTNPTELPSVCGTVLPQIRLSSLARKTIVTDATVVELKAQQANGALCDNPHRILFGINITPTHTLGEAMKLANPSKFEPKVTIEVSVLLTLEETEAQLKYFACIRLRAAKK